MNQLNQRSELPGTAKIMPMCTERHGPALLDSLGQRISRWLPSRSRSAPRLRLVETLTIGQRSSIAMIECDGMPMLVGLGRDGVTTISHLPASPTNGGLR